MASRKVVEAVIAALCDRYGSDWHELDLMQQRDIIQMVDRILSILELFGLLKSEV